jgi:hypothetical protein
MPLRSRILLPVLLVPAAALMLVACGEEQSASTVVASAGGSSASSTSQPEASGSQPEASGSDDSGASEATSTVPTGGGDVTAAEERIQGVVAGAAWNASVTDVSVAAGEETIVTLTTDDETFPALEACEAVRSALAGEPGLVSGQVAVNIWWTPDLTADGGDERQLATALAGGECELVRASE